MSSRVQFAGLYLQLRDHWYDITQDLPEGSPSTLARDDGSGALQFSNAKFRGGENPTVSLADLKSMLLEFAVGHDLGLPSEVHQADGSMLSVSADFVSTQEFIRAWYLSNGRDVCFVSFTRLEDVVEQDDPELAEASAIVRSVRFRP